MKHLKKRFSMPDNIFKIHWDMIKTAAAAAFYSFEPFLTHMRVQILFHFRFLCSGWPGSNLMGPNTCSNSGLRPTAKKKISKIECCFRPDKRSGDHEKWVLNSSLAFKFVNWWFRFLMSRTGYQFNIQSHKSKCRLTFAHFEICKLQL